MAGRPKSHDSLPLFRLRGGICGLCWELDPQLPASGLVAMPKFPPIAAVVVGLAFGPVLRADDAKPITPEALAFFESQVRPVLVEHCYECHSRRNGKA